MKRVVITILIIVIAYASFQKLEYKNNNQSSLPPELYPMALMVAVGLGVDNHWYPEGSLKWLNDLASLDKKNPPLSIEWDEVQGNHYSIQGRLLFGRETGSQEPTQCKDLYYSFTLDEQTFKPSNEKLYYANDC